MAARWLDKGAYKAVFKYDGLTSVLSAACQLPRNRIAVEVLLSQLTPDVVLELTKVACSIVINVNEEEEEFIPKLVSLFTSYNLKKDDCNIEIVIKGIITISEDDYTDLYLQVYFLSQWHLPPKAT